jgi:hypothetical protein
MPYWTQGVVSFHARNKQISITPITAYEVAHKDPVTRQENKYTIFLDTSTEDHLKARIFRTTRSFYIRDAKRLGPVLIQAALNKVRLEIAINDDPKNPLVSEVIIPARS